ncbi:hypothetical protein ES705_32519 [subsurface metagenome]
MSKLAIPAKASVIGRPLKGTKCPRCGKLGSGLHPKWVLNAQGKKYFPYYWYAHSIIKKGEKFIKWCYIKKKLANEILAKQPKK